MKLEFSYQSEVIVLPGAVMDKLPTASEQDLRLLLLLSYKKELLEHFDPAVAAEELGISEKEAELSVAFWRGAGILKGSRGKKKSEETAAILKEAAREKSALEKLKEEGEKDRRRALPAAVVPGDLPCYTGREVEEIVEKKGLTQLLKECQSLLGKVFNVSESNKILALSDTLHLPDEYILLLCSYCKSKGKGTVPYVTATACELYNDGITTGTALEEYIAQREKSHDFINHLRHLLGLGSRKLSAKEKRFFENWEKMNFPFEVVVFAYEQSVNATSELSLPHMNAILEGFVKAGVKTLQDAQKQSEEHAKEMKKLYSTGSASHPQPAEKKSDFTSFDSEDFFSAAKKKSLEKLKNEE